LTIVADAVLNDYSAYRSGDRFYVVIPEANVSSSVANGLRGQGFDDLRVQKRGNDVLLSFRLLQGALARVSQKSNRLDIEITVPALQTAQSATKEKDKQTSKPAPAGTVSSPPKQPVEPPINQKKESDAGGKNPPQTSAAGDDKVHLVDGSVLLGRVDKFSNGVFNLRVNSASGGVNKPLEASEVEKIEIDSTNHQLNYLRLIDGSIVHGVVTGYQN
jgi:hypothetical protein